MRPKVLIVAEIHRPHGLGGEIAASSLTDFPDRFREGAIFFLSPPVAGMEQVIVERVKETPRGFIFKFKGLDTRDDVEAIAKHNLVIPMEEATSLPDGELWVHEVIGVEVFTTGGEFLGAVTDVLRTGSNDVYVIGNGREYLIPATKEVVKEISLAENRMVIEPIPGLLE